MNLVLFNNFYWYLFNALGQKEAVHYSIEKLATQYIALIKKIQPEGPYEFVGWSFGGVLATEIARQLSANNEQINHIFIINSHFNFRQAVHSSYKSSDMAKKMFSSNINYFYRKPCQLNTNIVLFKSSKVDEKSEVLKILNETEANKFLVVSNHYAKTKDNHLNEVIACNNVKILPLTRGHLGWTACPDDVDFIAKSIKDSFAS